MRFLRARVAPIVTRPVMGPAKSIRIGLTGITPNRGILIPIRTAGKPRGRPMARDAPEISSGSVGVVVSMEVFNEQ